MLPPALRSSVLASLLGATAVLLPAQTAVTTVEAATAATKDSALTLEAFTVTGEKTSGYRAATAITATGLGTPIGATPLAIAVVTKELMQDAANYDMREALNFVPGVLTSPRGESTVVIRGFSGLISYRNGQYRRQLMTTWNMERVEVIKGPSAIFFGAVRPGGIVNNITTKPDFAGTASEVKLTVGNNEFYRAEAYHNQVVSDRLALRFGAGYIDRGGERQFEDRKETYFGFSAVWRPTPHQQLTLDLEGINRKGTDTDVYLSRSLANSRVLGNPAAIAFQANVNKLTTTADSTNRAFLTSLGFSSNPAAPNFAPTFDMFAPADYKTAVAFDSKERQESQSVDLDYVLKLRPNLVWQTTLNAALDDTGSLQPATGETRPFADGSVRLRTEDFINVRYSENIHNKLTWQFDLGRSSHTFVLGQELQHVRFVRPGFLDSQNRFNDSPFGAFTANFFPGLTPAVSLQALSAASGQGFNVVRKRDEDNYGYFVAQQSNFFEGRIHLLAGLRRNVFKGDIHYNRPISNSSLSAANGGLSDRDVVGSKSGWTPQAGALVKVLPGLSLFGTYSESIEPNFQLDADGVSSEPVESDSLDLGLKAELLGGRLTGSFAYYNIDRSNLAVRDTLRELATNRAPFFFFGNSERSEGYEVEANWSPIDNYNIVASYSHSIDASVARSVNNPQLEGRPLAYVPDTFNVWQRYRVTSGPLKNVTLAFGVRHNDAAAASSDPQVAVTVPSFTVYDAMVGYSLKLLGRDTNFQINVKNLTDKLYREGGDGFFGRKRDIIFSLQTRF